MKELTVFKSIFSNATTRGLTFENWDKFEEALFGMSKVPVLSLSAANATAAAQRL